MSVSWQYRRLCDDDDDDADANMSCQTKRWLKNANAKQFKTSAIKRMF